jgi:hypothetical protein
LGKLASSARAVSLVGCVKHTDFGRGKRIGALHAPYKLSRGMTFEAHLAVGATPAGDGRRPGAETPSDRSKNCHA